MQLFIHGVGNRQINRRKPIRLPQSDRCTWTKRKSDSRYRKRARARRAGLLAGSKSKKHSWRRGATLHPSEPDDFAPSLTLSQIGGDPTTVRNEAMNAVTFAGGSASALST